METTRHGSLTVGQVAGGGTLLHGLAWPPISPELRSVGAPVFFLYWNMHVACTARQSSTRAQCACLGQPDQAADGCMTNVLGTHSRERTHIHTHSHSHTRTHTHTRAHARTQTRTHACTHTRTCTRTHTQCGMSHLGTLPRGVDLCGGGQCWLIVRSPRAPLTALAYCPGTAESPAHSHAPQSNLVMWKPSTRDIVCNITYSCKKRNGPILPRMIL